MDIKKWQLEFCSYGGDNYYLYKGWKLTEEWYRDDTYIEGEDPTDGALLRFDGMENALASIDEDMEQDEEL